MTLKLLLKVVDRCVHIFHRVPRPELGMVLRTNGFRGIGSTGSIAYQHKSLRFSKDIVYPLR